MEGERWRGRFVFGGGCAGTGAAEEEMAAGASGALPQVREVPAGAPQLLRLRMRCMRHHSPRSLLPLLWLCLVYPLTVQKLSIQELNLSNMSITGVF
jgi:hypothetical protein